MTYLPTNENFTVRDLKNMHAKFEEMHGLPVTEDRLKCLQAMLLITALTSVSVYGFTLNYVGLDEEGWVLFNMPRVQ